MDDIDMEELNSIKKDELSKENNKEQEDQIFKIIQIVKYKN